MKRTEKIALSVISLVCFGLCSFSLPVLANTSTVEPTSSGETSEAVSSVASQGEDSSNSAVSSEEPVSSEEDTGSQTENISSAENVSSTGSTATAVSSQKSYSSAVSANSSKSSTSSKSTTLGNGTINDDIDNSGWGTNAENTSSQTASVGMAADSANGKKMFNLAKIIWYTIWIPIALIVASVVVLVHVNKKSFLEENTGSTVSKNTSKTEPNGHTYHGNKKGASRKKVPKKNIYRPHD